MVSLTASKLSPQQVRVHPQWEPCLGGDGEVFSKEADFECEILPAI